MKHIKTFESHSNKKDMISKSELEEILGNSNMVTLPYYTDEDSLYKHIDTSFDDSDVALVFNPSQELTMVNNKSDIVILYTKNKTYVISDVSESEYNGLCADFG